MLTTWQLEQIQVRLAEIESVRADARLALLALDGRVSCVEYDIGLDLTQAEREFIVTE